MKAVIPVAGLGTRFLPATKSMPKEMVPVLNKPVIQYVVEEAVDVGIEDILLVTGRNKRAIEDHFDHSIELESHLQNAGKTDLLEIVNEVADLASIHFVRQSEPLGLGHAVLCAKRFVGDDPFAVLLGDDILLDAQKSALSRLVGFHDAHDSHAFSVMEVPDEAVHRYGIIEPDGPGPMDGTHRVRAMVEKPTVDVAPSRLASIGRYVFNPSMMQELEAVTPGVGGEIQLTDAMASMARKEPMYAVEFHGKRLDVGNVEGFLEANMELASRDPALRDHLQRLARHYLGQGDSP